MLPTERFPRPHMYPFDMESAYAIMAIISHGLHDPNLLLGLNPKQRCIRYQDSNAGTLADTFKSWQGLALRIPEDDWQLHQTPRSSGFPFDGYFESSKFRGHDYSLGNSISRPCEHQVFKATGLCLPCQDVHRVLMALVWLLPLVEMTGSVLCRQHLSL